MTDQGKDLPLKTPEEFAAAMDQALNHVANAHRMLEAVRKCAQAGEVPSSDGLLREIGRAWHSLDIAGSFCTRLHRHFEGESER